MNTFQQLDNLHPVLHQTRMTWEQQQAYEELDCTATTACLLAEKQCRKFKMGQVPWTPDLTRKIYRILYWKGVISCVLGHRVGTSVLRTRACKAGLDRFLSVRHFPMETLKNNAAKAIQQYWQLLKDPNRWDTWLGQMIEAQSQATRQKTKRLWQQIRSRKRIKLTAKQVKIALGKVTTHRPLERTDDNWHSARMYHTFSLGKCLSSRGRKAIYSGQ